MIVVIADDLSGAAELANIARQSGLTAEVRWRGQPPRKVDLCAIDLNTRSLPAEMAGQRMADTYRTVLTWQPEWVYRKVDSVLRGQVGFEIEAMLAAAGQRRALLVPANPRRQRTIVGSRYFVQGAPLDQSPLARDPDHPRRSCHLRDLVPVLRIPLHAGATPGPTPCEGIAIPDVTCDDDLTRLANLASGYEVVAGAAEFFEALLRVRGAAALPCAPPNAVPHDLPRALPHGPTPVLGGKRGLAGGAELLVCGSRVAWPERLALATACGQKLFALPPTWWGDLSLGADESDPTALLPYSEWLDDVVATLRHTGRAGIGIGELGAESNGNNPPIRTDLLLQGLAAAAEHVAQRVPVNRWLLEGGATASAVLRRLNVDSCALGDAQEAGIGELRHPGIDQVRYYVKPGSYAWPTGLWPGID